MEICKILIESGFFALGTANPAYPHRRACWGNRIFLRGAPGTDWETEALRFRDWLCQAQSWWTQVILLKYYVRTEPLPDIRPQDMDWGMSNILWDIGRGEWPDSPFYPSPTYAPWVGQKYRSNNVDGAPLPPSVAYRWERITPTLGGRRHYGYLRCVERRWFRTTNPEATNCLPFFFVPNRLTQIHTAQIANPSTTTGVDNWHIPGNPVREVVISHRGGATSVHEVAGYDVGIVHTTARNFSLPML